MRTHPHAHIPERLLLPRRLVPRRPPIAPFLHKISDDTMVPTYRPRIHAVMCVPVARYSGEGVYLVDSDLYRCQRQGRRVYLTRDNAAYPDYEFSEDEFNSQRLALVVADVRIHDPASLREMMEQAA